MAKCVLSLMLLLMLPATVQADIVIMGDDRFKADVQACLDKSKALSVHLKRLVETAEAAPVPIRIRPIADDPATYRFKGTGKMKCHTKPLDKLKLDEARTAPTESVIYLRDGNIDPAQKTYKNGSLIHELALAVDLATGHYNGDGHIREKRAVFFQNIWRELHGKDYRNKASDQCVTEEYLRAKSNGQIDQFVEHYFSDSDLP